MIHKHLLDIADNFDTFFFDAWGVFNFGGPVSQSAIAVMAELMARGKSVSIMSNTPQTVDGMMAHYAKNGLVSGVHFQNAFSSGQLCYERINSGALPVSGKSYYIAWDNTGSPLLNAQYNLFRDSDYVQVSDINDADFVYCDFPTHSGALFSDEGLMAPELEKLAMMGLPIICANADLHAMSGGVALITQGLPCKILEQRGVPVIYYGKPYPEIYTDAMTKLVNPDPSRTVMIGDTLHTDILGATRAGIRSCLTLVGGISANDLTAQGLDLTRANLDAAAVAIGARIDYVIEKVPANEL